MSNSAKTLLICCTATALAVGSFAQSRSVGRATGQTEQAAAPTTAQAIDLFQQHRWAEAAAAFAECEKNAPGKTAALLYRGKSLVNLGQFDEAASSLQSYRNTHPQSDDATYLLAYIRFRENKPKDSLQLFTEAARLHDPSADDLKVVALDYVLLSDYDHAARYLEESLAKDPENI
jgi:tetratricopeptide (TPR) repeat protein